MEQRDLYRFSKYKFLLIILLICFLLMFINLGGRFLWGDEVEVAQVAKGILRVGYPTGNDGRNILYYNFPEDVKSLIYGENNPQYIWKWHPWLTHYITALSFLVLGVNTFSSRFSFALLGLLSIIILYFLSRKITKDKSLANLSILLLAFYIPFYLYSRQCRYYSLSIFLSLLAICCYIKLINGEKNSSIYFSIAGILCFYTQSNLVAAVCATALMHSLLFKRDKLKKVILCLLIIFIFALPWIIYAGSFSKINTDISEQMFSLIYISLYVLFYIFSISLIMILPCIIFDRENGKIKINEFYCLILFFIFFSILFIIFIPYGYSSLRHITFIFPFVMILTAAIILKIKKYSKMIAAIILILVLFTNWLNVIPFKPLENQIASKFAFNSDKYLFVKDNLKVRYFFFDYLQEISSHYTTPDERISGYINAHSDGKESFIGTATIPLIFYTNLTEYSSDDSNKSPDWIIPRKSYYLWGESEDYNMMLSYINDKYEKIVINSTEYIYPIDSPEPRVHRFKENINLTTSDIYPYETYPIEIYHLKENKK